MINIMTFATGVIAAGGFITVSVRSSGSITHEGSVRSKVRCRSVRSSSLRSRCHPVIMHVSKSTVATPHQRAVCLRGPVVPRELPGDRAELGYRLRLVTASKARWRSPTWPLPTR